MPYQIVGYGEIPMDIIHNKSLMVPNQGLKVLPAIPKGTKVINCQGNTITQLPHLPEGLIVLKCEENNIHELPPLPLTLKALLCDSNPLVSLPELPEGIVSITASSTNIKTIPYLPESLILFDAVKLPMLNEPFRTFFDDYKYRVSQFMYINEDNLSAEELPDDIYVFQDGWGGNIKKFIYISDDTIALNEFKNNVNSYHLGEYENIELHMPRYIRVVRMGKPMSLYNPQGLNILTGGYKKLRKSRKAMMKNGNSTRKFINYNMRKQKRSQKK